MSVFGYLSLGNAEVGLVLIVAGAILLTIIAAVFILSKKPITTTDIAWLVVVILIRGIGPVIYFAYLAFHRDEITNKPGYQVFAHNCKRIFKRVF